MPKLSVIIPVHNGQKRLLRTVKGVLAQNYKDLELILVENGSKDKSWDICKKICESDRRVKVYQSEQGTTLARKYGVMNSTGEYITFSDQDDYYINSQAFSEMMELVDQEEADITQFGYYINSFGRIRKHCVQNAYTVDRAQLLDATCSGIFGAFKGDLGTSVWNKVYKGSSLRTAVTGMTAVLFRAEDMYLNTFAFLNENVKKVALFPDAFYVWRTGVGTYNALEGASALFDEYRIVKPTIFQLSESAGVGYEPIMRTHRETLNFLNGLISQSILSGASEGETVKLLRKYATYDFVSEAARFFSKPREDGTEWDQHIKECADIWNTSAYYNRVKKDIGNIKTARFRQVAKRHLKRVLRWIDKL